VIHSGFPGGCTDDGHCIEGVSITGPLNGNCPAGDNDDWISLAFPVRTEGTVIDTIEMTHTFNPPTGTGGHLYLVEDCGGQPNVENILWEGCDAVTPGNTGTQFYQVNPPVITGALTWVVVVPRTSFAFDVAFNPIGNGTSTDLAFANLTGTGNLGEWFDVSDEGYGYCYCVSLHEAMVECPPWGDSNAQKYWCYRARLINDFMLIGDCQGESLPASIRNFHSGPTMKFGDTTIDLGWYIAVLATEFHLLKGNNQDTTGTERELYFALRAFNRLDEFGETYWSGGVADLNGWFIRGDQCENFVSTTNTNPQNDTDVSNHYFHFNSNQYSTMPVTETESDFNDHPRDGNVCVPSPNPAEESHDQVWHLLMGFALVKKFVDPTAQYNGMNFHTETDAIVQRMVGYFNWAWIIKNPVTGGKAPGNNAGAFSWGAAEAACKITSGFSSGLPSLCVLFHNLFSIHTKDLWQLFKKGKLLGKEEDKIEIIAALGSSWYSQTFPIFDVTAAFLAIRSRNAAFEHTALFHGALYGVTPKVPQGIYECLLDTAPCKGPYNFGGAGNYASCEWSSNSRFVHPEARGHTATFFPGAYNGLDYMLLYNLYHLTWADVIPGYAYCQLGPGTPPTCVIPNSNTKVCDTWNNSIPYRQCKKQCKNIAQDCKDDCKDAKKLCKAAGTGKKACRKLARDCKKVCRQARRDCKDVCRDDKKECPF